MSMSPYLEKETVIIVLSNALVRLSDQSLNNRFHRMLAYSRHLPVEYRNSKLIDEFDDHAVLRQKIYRTRVRKN
jgi:hypothetical protein